MLVSAARNPFQGMRVSNRYLGSRKVRGTLLELLGTQQTASAEVYGLPGMGKSSLLRCLFANGRDLDHRHPQGGTWLPVFIDSLSMPRQEHPFVYLHSQFQKQSEAAHSDLAASSKMSRGDPAGSLDNLQALAIQASQHKIRPVILMDDFHLMFRIFEPIDAERLRSIQPWASFVLATEESLLETNRAAIGSPFFASLTTLFLEGLARDEAKDLLQSPTHEITRAFPEGDIETVLDLIGPSPHPNLLMEAGSELWETRASLTLEPRQRSLKGEEQRIFESRLRYSLRRTFQVYWTSLRPRQQDALKTVVTGGSLQDADHDALAPLLKLGLIRYTPGPKVGYKVSTPLFGEYLGRLFQFSQSPPVSAEQEETELSHVERRVYDFLRRHPGETCSFETIWDAVWGGQFPRAKPQRIQVTVSRLRQKLKERGDDIVSVRGQGYRYMPQAS